MLLVLLQVLLLLLLYLAQRTGHRELRPLQVHSR